MRIKKKETTVTSRVGISVHTENQDRSDPGQGHEALAGSNLEPMQEDSGPGKEHVTLAGPNPEHMDEDFYATSYPKVHENLKLRTDEHVILENPESSSATLSSMKNLDETNNFGDQFLNDKPIEDDLEKTNVVTSAPPVNAPVMNISSPTPSSHVNAPPINTEATAIITTLPEITPFIALQLRVAKLEQDMSEYLGTKLDDALLKTLERHTSDLVEKYSVLPAPKSSKKQESEKSPKEIIRIKKEQEEKKQEPTYTIKSTDKDALEEFDLKSALFKSMHKNKSANRNPANYRLYHALMKALIEDENVMDNEVADTGKSSKKRRTRESNSAKKPSTTKESSKGKDPKVGSKTGKSAPAKDPFEEPTEKVIMDEQPTEDIPISEEGHVSDLEDTDNAHMLKIPDTTTWFRPILEEERHASPESEWVIPPIDLPEADNNWANAFAKAHQDP
ncbi:hypothetical protein Tco_1520335, partial [Tanacetum coccineum]